MSSPNNPPNDPHPPPPAGGDAAPGAERVLQAIMFTDIEGSVSLDQTLGTARYARVLTRHGELFYQALAAVGEGYVEKHTGDGFMARFTRPSDAVGAALRFQWLLRHEEWEMAQPLRVRIGIHQGEILLLPSEKTMPGTIGAPINLASRVMSMAEGGQVLLTHAVFDDARQFVKTIPEVPAPEQAALGWEAHGAYRVKGIEDPVDIFEVGERGHGPFRQPKNVPGVERSVSKEEEAMLGWRPAPNLEIPRRPGWMIARQLGEGGFGEVWLAENRRTQEHRVFKFCFDAVRLRSFKREVMLFQLIREALGPQRDIATLYEVQLEASPFFLESEFCAGGTLSDWITAKMAAGGVPLALRLSLVARVARALGAAHSVGIIHKDVKPSNIFIEEAGDGSVHPRLADFGIGVLVDRSALDGLDVAFTGELTITIDASRTGTRMYSAPEYMQGLPPSILGDIYSLGVLLYQVVIGDFRRPIGPGWRRDVPDALLQEDIAACVDVDPARRPSSALLVAEKIESLEPRRAALAAAAAAVEREQELQRQMVTQKRRVRLALVSAAVAAVVIGALGVMLFVLERSRVAVIAHSKDIEAQRETARDRLYVADMQAATDDMLKWRAEAARETINRQRPAAGERDRRGWEWYFADSVLNTRQIVRKVSAQPLRAMAVSPDGQSVAVAGDEGGVSVWSCGELKKIRALPAGAVRCLGWSATGSLAAGLGSGEVVVWDAASGVEKKRWKAHDGAVAALGWQPSEDLLVTGGADGVLASWRGDGRPVGQWPRRGPVLALDWRQDGSEIAVVLGHPGRLLAGALDGLDHEFALDAEESALAWRPGVHEVAIAKGGVPMRSWDPRTTVDSFYLPNSFSPGASSYAWSPTGESVAIGGIDGKIYLLDVRRMTDSRTALYGHSSRVTAMQWLGGEQERLLSVGDDGTLRAWDDLHRSPEITFLPFKTPLTDAQWNPRTDKLALMFAGDEVQVLRCDTWQTEWSRPLPVPLEGRSRFLGGHLAWSPDGRWLAAVCPGRLPVVWCPKDGKRITAAGLQDASEVCWMQDSRRLLVRGAKGWSWFSTDDGRATAIPGTANAAWVAGLEGEALGIVAAEDGALRYRLASLAGGSARPDVALPGGLGAVRCGAVSPDRTLLALAGESGALLWLDTRTGAARRPALAHSGPIKSLGWHPDGTRLATVGADGTCRVFNVTQATQTWVIEHELPPEIVANGWSGNGRRLMVASGAGKLVKIYDASRSLAVEKGEVGEPAETALAERLTRACAWIEQHPGEEFGWHALAQLVTESRGGGADAQADLLLAAADLGVRALFTPPGEGPQQTALATTWQGVELPRAVQILQAGALKHWEDVLPLCAGQHGLYADAAWFALARAEALAALGRGDEAEAANLEAWQALRRHHGGDDRIAVGPADSSAIGANLAPWANVKLTEDWTGGENNNLASLPAVLAQPDGVSFHLGDFIQLAGKSFRLSSGRMLPRSTGWMPLGRSATRASFALAACYADQDEQLQDTCIGSLFLLRSTGRGAVRIPLIYGRNVWDWWVPSGGHIAEAPAAAVAWRGDNPNAQYYEHGLALYRLAWKAGPGQAPIAAVSLVTHLRRPAPMLMAAEAQP